MLRRDQRSAVLLQVRRTGKGRTAETRMNRASVLPPHLVLPFLARTHGGAGGRTRSRARICLYVRQGKEVGQSKDRRGFPPSYLASYLAEAMDGRSVRRLPPTPFATYRGSFPNNPWLRVMQTPIVFQFYQWLKLH